MAIPATLDQVSAALRGAAEAGRQSDGLTQVQQAADAFALCLASDTDRATVETAAATEIARRTAIGPAAWNGGM